MPKWFARRMLPVVAVSAVSAVASAQSPLQLPRPVAPMPTPAALSMTERQVRVECVLLSMPLVVWTKHAAALSKEGPGASIVTGESKAMAFVQAIKGESEILARPQLLLLDRQTGFFHVGQASPTDKHSDPACGHMMRLTPKVSPDGAKVELKAEYQHTAANAAFGVKRPDGQVIPGFTHQTMQTTAILADGGVVIIPTSLTDAAQHVLVLKAHITRAEPRTMVIPVAELVAPWPAWPGEPGALGKLLPVDAPQMMPAVSPAGFAIPAPNPAPAPPMTHPGAANAQALCKLVTNMVRPYSWAVNGGTGVVTFDAGTGSLLVSQQSAEVQAEVAQFVAALRKLQEKGCGRQVAIETRVVEVTETFFERLGVEFQPVKGENEKGVAFLTDAQLAAVVSAAQADRQTSVLAMPKMVCFDGQRGVFQVGQREVFQTGLELSATPGGVDRKPKMEAVDLGMRLAVTPTVSADRRFVRLELRYETASLAGVGPAVPVVAGIGDPADALCRPTVQTGEVTVTVAVPDGRTTVVVGPAAVREGRPDFGPPVVSRIPYVNRLFKNIGASRTAVRQLLLVTPRVLPADEPAGTTKVVARACCDEPCTECRAVNPQVAELVAAYRKACAEGRTDAAAALAVKALALDPTCFAVPHGSK